MTGRPPTPAWIRVVRRVEFQPSPANVNGDCWIYPGRKNHGGYGVVKTGSRLDGTYGESRAHRIVYEALKGRIPEGLEPDHLCKEKTCVNPYHLEPVTHHENLMRGDSPAGLNARKTHCKRGHPFDQSNTHWRPDGRRLCRTCNRERKRLKASLKKA